MLKKIKNQFGFTLIELLAVIVILAIIALIATPIILNVISDVRYESYKRSAEFYTSALRNSLALEDLNNDGGFKLPDGSYPINSDGTLCIQTTYNDDTKKFTCEEENKLKIDIDKTMPTGGWVLIKDNKIIWYDLVVNGVNIPYESYTDESCFEAEGNRLKSYKCDDTKVIIPPVINGKKITTIGLCNSSAHSNIMKNAEKVIIPSGVTSIECDAFAGTSTSINNLKEVFLSPTIENFYLRAFAYNQISEIILPMNIRKIPNNIFLGNNIKNVVVPNNIYKLGPHSPFGTKLETITIGSGIKVIDSYTFGSSLKNITIKSSPENVEIKQYALPGTIVDCTKGTPTQNQTCINWEY